MLNPPRPPPDPLKQLRESTRGARNSLLATVVLVDASIATRNEWLSIATDYIGPHINYISGKFLDHMVCSDARATPK